MTGIYLITNKVNGKQYVGQALDIEGRWKQHRIDSKKYDYVIYRAMRKYGVENFSFEVLEECPIDKLDEREIYWIDKLDTYNNGYNMTLGGEGHNQGKDSYSEEYIKEYSKQYNKDHKEEQKQYRDAHREEQKQYQKQWYQNHKEELKQYYQDHKEDKKQWYQNHKEELKQYYQDHKEDKKQYQRQYQQEHKDEFKLYMRQYRAKKKASKSAIINIIQIEVPLW